MCLVRYPHVEKDHLVKLLKQLLSGAASSSQGLIGQTSFNASAVPTLLGTGSFSLLSGISLLMLYYIMLSFWAFGCYSMHPYMSKHLEILTQMNNAYGSH